MQRTGYRSTEAVSSYKRTSRERFKQVSDILNNDMLSQAFSLECKSPVTPVFNIASCSSVTINYSTK